MNDLLHFVDSFTGGRPLLENGHSIGWRQRHHQLVEHQRRNLQIGDASNDRRTGGKGQDSMPTGVGRSGQKGDDPVPIKQLPPKCCVVVHQLSFYDNCYFSRTK
jgi:hypothetical protein